jgi:hypothetical protein
MRADAPIEFGHLRLTWNDNTLRRIFPKPAVEALLGVKPQVGLSLTGIWSVTFEAAVRKDRSDVKVVADLLRNTLCSRWLTGIPDNQSDDHHQGNSSKKNRAQLHIANLLIADLL